MPAIQVLFPERERVTEGIGSLAVGQISQLFLFGGLREQGVKRLTKNLEVRGFFFSFPPVSLNRLIFFFFHFSERPFSYFRLQDASRSLSL